MNNGYGSYWTLALLKEGVKKKWSRYSGTLQYKAAFE